MSLQRAIKVAGGRRQLAVACGVSYQAVQKWQLQGIPASRCGQVEAATGIPCEELRPDLEWHTLPDGRKVAVGQAQPKRRKAA